MGNKKLIVVVGATGSGKTAYAIELAKKKNTVIINADSRQVYREMLIGTARPPESEQQNIPHYLLGHVSIHDHYNAGRFAEEALQLLSTLFLKHDEIIVCGGTGLYLNALINGFDELPETDHELRAQVTLLYQQKGLVGLQEKLQKLDPVYFEKIDQQNPQRMMRAIELCLQTGKTHLELHNQQKHKREFTVEKIGLLWEREKLYERINQRVNQMISSGLESEAKELFPFRHLAPLKTVGYSEFFEYFEGQQDLATTLEKIKQHSRNYAKRQLTWFKRDEEIKWLNQK